MVHKTFLELHNMKHDQQIKSDVMLYLKIEVY